MKVGVAFCTMAVAGFLTAPALLGAAAQPIGFAVADSKFIVGSSVVEGLATLFEGDSITSSYLATRLNLKDGSRYVLGIDSEGIVHRNYLSLESGSVEILGQSGAPRVVAAPLSVTPGKPGTAATIYRTGKDRISVQVRSGEVKVARSGSSEVRTLGAGQLVSIRVALRGGMQVDSDGAVFDVTQVQSQQISSLLEASKSYTCLQPRAAEAARSFAALSSQLAAARATQNVIAGRIGSGAATALDYQSMASVNNTVKNLNQASASLSQELDVAVDITSEFHHPGPPAPYPSPHTVHGHINLYPHHGQHGHTLPPDYPGNTPYGDHQVPPHHYAQPPAG